MNKGMTKILSATLCMSLLAGSMVSGGTKVYASETTAVDTVTSVVSGPGVGAVDVTQIKISKIKAVLQVGKTTTPVITGTNSPIQWTSSNESVATVDETGKVKGKKKGKATIIASMDGVTRICTVTVVPKMEKADFSKFNSENFVSYCQKHRYNHGFAWNGQWKGGSKKKKTKRGITIGSSVETIENAYGELSWKKCSSKEPFSNMKGLKKNKVKKYGDAVYGKYRIRFYVNSKKKVVAIIFACNISKIKKKHLKKYL